MIFLVGMTLETAGFLKDFVFYERAPREITLLAFRTKTKQSTRIS